MAIPEAPPILQPNDSILPLLGRYQAAWSEQCARIGLRQGVIQIYFTAVAILFGFWVTSQAPLNQGQSATSHGQAASSQISALGNQNPAHTTQSLPLRVERQTLDALLGFGVSTLTLFSAVLIWMHNRVIHHITCFLTNCERYAGESDDDEKKGIDLFYFLDSRSKLSAAQASFIDKEKSKSTKVDDFHSQHRMLQKVVFALIILAPTNILAIWLAHNDSYVRSTFACSGMLLISMVFLLEEPSKEAWRRLTGSL